MCNLPPNWQIQIMTVYRVGSGQVTLSSFPCSQTMWWNFPRQIGNKSGLWLQIICFVMVWIGRLRRSSIWLRCQHPILCTRIAETGVWNSAKVRSRTIKSEHSVGNSMFSREKIIIIKILTKPYMFSGKVFAFNLTHFLVFGQFSESFLQFWQFSTDIEKPN